MSDDGGAILSDYSGSINADGVALRDRCLQILRMDYLIIHIILMLLILFRSCLSISIIVK